MSLRANEQQFFFELLDKKEIEFLVLSFTSENHCLFGDYRFHIVCKGMHRVLPDEWIGQWGKLTIKDAKGKPFVTGMVYSVDKKMHESIIISIASPMVLLKNTQTPAVFLEKSLEDITKAVFQYAGLAGDQLQFHAGSHNKPLDMKIHDRDSDFEYLTQQWKEQGYTYAIEQTDNVPKVHVYPLQDWKFPSNKPVAIQVLEPKGMHLPEPTIIRWAANIHTNVKKPYATFEAISTRRGLNPGEIIQVTDSVNPIFDGRYVIVSVEHEGSTARSIPYAHHGTGNERDILDYFNRLVLIKEQDRDEWQKPIALKKQAYLRTAFIESTDEHHALLDDKGAYHLRYPFDEENHTKGKKSMPLVLSSALWGNDEGIHFPLRDNTEVVLLHNEGAVDTAVMLGALSNPSTPDPVNDEEPFMHRIRSYADNKIEMDDREDLEVIRMSTKFDLNQINITAQKDQNAIQFISKNEVAFTAGKTGKIETRASALVKSDKDSTILVEQNYAMEVSDRGFEFGTQEVFQSDSKQDLVMKTPYFSANVEEHLTMHAGKNITLKVKEQDCRIITETGSVNITVNKNTTIAGLNINNVLLEQGSSQLIADKSGMLQFACADTIKFISPKIKVITPSDGSNTIS